MVGHKLAEARFHPPYKVVDRRVGQVASFGAANADPPSAANQIKRHVLEGRPNNGGSQTR